MTGDTVCTVRGCGCDEATAVPTAPVNTPAVWTGGAATTTEDCPFCGDKSDLHQDFDDYWSVFCRNEECKGNVGPFPRRDDALYAWGSRQALPNNRKLAIAEQELRALAALIRRPPLDDVLLTQSLALRIAVAIDTLVGDAA